MIIHSRSEWHARTPKPMAIQGPPVEAFIHHSDSSDANRIDHLSEMLDAVNGIQRFHMETRGWSDIAYHYVVFQRDPNHDHPIVVAGRGINFVPAAQLGHNTGTLAIVVYGNFERDKVRPGTVRTLAALVREHHSVETVGGHRDVVSTSCPGDHLYGKMDEIARAAGVKRYRH